MSRWKRNGPAGVATTEQALTQRIKTIIATESSNVKGKLKRCSCGANFEPNPDRPHCCRECRDEAAHGMLKALTPMNASQKKQMQHEHRGLGFKGWLEIEQGKWNL